MTDKVLATYEGQQEIAEAIRGINLEALTQKAVWVDSVSDMRELDAPQGITVATRGYYSPNDGGNGFYYIQAKEVGAVDDGGSVIFLDNDNEAKLITDGTVNVKQFGAKGDNDNDDTSAIQKAISFGEVISFPYGNYLISDKIIINHDITIYGNNATIKANSISVTLLDLIYVVDSKIKIHELVIDGGSIDNTTSGVNGIVFVSCEVTLCNLYMKNFTYHCILINGGTCIANNIKFYNIGKYAGYAFVYTDNGADTEWTNVYLEQPAFSYDDVGHGFYLHDGNHVINNVIGYNIEKILDIRSGSAFLNNGYFYNTSGLGFVTNVQNAQTDVVVSNCVFKNVHNDKLTRCYININAIHTLKLQNIVMIIDPTDAQSAYPPWYLVIVRSFGDAIGSILFDNVRFYGYDIITQNGIMVRDSPAGSKITLNNCRFPGNAVAKYIARLTGTNEKIEITFNNFEYDGNITLYAYSDELSGRYPNFIYHGNYKTFGDTANRPTPTPTESFVYFDTDLNKAIIWAGVGWKNMDGTWA